MAVPFFPLRAAESGKKVENLFIFRLNLEEQRCILLIVIFCAVPGGQETVSLYAASQAVPESAETRLPVYGGAGSPPPGETERRTAVLNIVLVEPEIPQNCGNIARTCAATGSRLHLVRPLGFDISDRAVRRAGLDYWHMVEVFDYGNLSDLFRRRPECLENLWLATTKAPRPYTEADFSPDCWLFFGKETAGLPADLRARFRERCVRLPMRGAARSLNLSNSVAVLVYEALRQNDFPGLDRTGEMAEAGDEIMEPDNGMEQAAADWDRRWEIKI